MTRPKPKHEIDKCIHSLAEAVSSILDTSNKPTDKKITAAKKHLKSAVSDMDKGLRRARKKLGL